MKTITFDRYRELERKYCQDNPKVEGLFIPAQFLESYMSTDEVDDDHEYDLVEEI